MSTAETAYNQGNDGDYMSTVGNLGDIPDLSGITGDGPAADPFVDGWYEGTILAKREFTDKNGNDRVFESSDTTSARGDSRNIRLQVTIKRNSDGKTLNSSVLVNYQPDDLTQETVQKVAAQAEEVAKSGADWGSLFRSRMTLVRLGKLQKIASVRQLRRNGDGGLDLGALFGKVAWFKLGDDSRNPQFKEIKDFRDTKPTRVPVL